MIVYYHKLTGEGTSQIDVGRVRLETLVVSQNLGGRSCGHGRHEKTVSETLRLHTLTHRVPVVTTAEFGLTFPHIRLKNTLRSRRPCETLIGSLNLSQFRRSLESRMVHRLEDVCIHETRLFTVEGETTKNKHVSETLNAETDGAMFHVRSSSRLYGVEVTIDDTIEILRDRLRDFVKFVVVESLGLPVHILGEGDGCEVAHRRLVFVSVLQNLGTVPGQDTIEYTAMSEWFIKTESICGITEIFDRYDLLKVKCLTVWLRFGREIQTSRVKSERLQEFDSTTWNEKTPQLFAGVSTPRHVPGCFISRHVDAIIDTHSLKHK